MSALIKWEFKKLLLNRGMVINLLAAVVFVIAGCAGISTYPDSVKFTQNGEVYYSNEAIARNKDVIQKYGGIMTDEKVQRIIDAFHLEEAIKERVTSETPYDPYAAKNYDSNLATGFVMERLVDDYGVLHSVKDLTGMDELPRLEMADFYVETVHDIGSSMMFLFLIAAVIFPPYMQTKDPREWIVSSYHPDLEKKRSVRPNASCPFFS